MLLFICVDIYKLVSLFAGLKYGMEPWNEKWNGMANVHNSCN